MHNFRNEEKIKQWFAQELMQACSGDQARDVGQLLVLEPAEVEEGGTSTCNVR